MILAKLIKRRWFWVGVSIEDCAYVVFLRLCFFDFLGLEEVGLGGALEECCWGLAGKSSDVLVENVIALLTLQLHSFSFH